MADGGQARHAIEALRRAAQIVRSFRIERRMEDEPAHHDQALERLAEPEPRR